MDKIEKMAEKDAVRWMAAEMFYGEGAGTRRKLLDAELESKFTSMPNYYEAFTEVYTKLDRNKFAQAAIKERKKIDRAAKAGKNIRALKSGNLNNLTTGVFVIAGAVYVAHVTGYDKVIEAEAKKRWHEAKREYLTWKQRRHLRSMQERA